MNTIIWFRPLSNGIRNPTVVYGRERLGVVRDCLGVRTVKSKYYFDWVDFATANLPKILGYDVDSDCLGQDLSDQRDQVFGTKQQQAQIEFVLAGLYRKYQEQLGLL